MPAALQRVFLCGNISKLGAIVYKYGFYCSEGWVMVPGLLFINEA
jgi:hypothetical protein